MKNTRPSLCTRSSHPDCICKRVFRHTNRSHAYRQRANSINVSVRRVSWLCRCADGRWSAGARVSPRRCFILVIDEKLSSVGRCLHFPSVWQTTTTTVGCLQSERVSHRQSQKTYINTILRMHAAIKRACERVVNLCSCAHECSTCTHTCDSCTCKLFVSLLLSSGCSFRCQRLAKFSR